MIEQNLPNDRFAWLGVAPPPDGVVIPEDDSLKPVDDLLTPNQVNGQDSLGIFRWLMADEDERKEVLSGCRLFDNFVYMEIPKEDD